MKVIDKTTKEQDLKKKDDEEIEALYLAMKERKKQEKAQTKGYTYELKGDKLIITVNMSNETRESSSGKTDLVASGLEKLSKEFSGFSFGLNVYKKKEKKEDK